MSLTDINSKLLYLIKKGKSVNQIVEELNISHKELLRRMKSVRNDGFDFETKYYYDGNITYNLIKEEPSTSNNYNENTIITKNSDNEITVMVISDLHMGCVLENLEAIDSIYNYCAKKGINIIINTGDLMNGFLGITEKIHKTYAEQIEYVVEKYPFDKNILNFICLGNHDLASKLKTGQDFMKYLSNHRIDFVPLGYGECAVNIKREKIVLFHSIHKKFETSKYSNSLVLKGHEHMLKSTVDKNTIISVPSLSNLGFEEMMMDPSALVMKLTFKNGLFEKCYIENLKVTEKIVKVGELTYDLSSFNRKVPMSKIPNVEPYNFSERPQKIKVMTGNIDRTIAN